MEFETLSIEDPRYPRKLLQRLETEAPTLFFHGPLKLLDRFTMAVVASDQIPGQAMLATNDMLFKIREYAMNYIGPWHSVMETEIFRLALDTPTDEERRRSLTIFTARGLARETWDNFLGDRFGYKGPFTGFPQKEEFYRRARDKELLWLSVADPGQKRFERRNILKRNRIACALADVVFVPFSEKGAKTFVTIKQVLKDKVPIFTSQYGRDKETDVNKDLFMLGVPSYTRKTVGQYLESLGALTNTPPPFHPKADSSPDVVEESAARTTKLRQTSFL
jgi:predicted Rossmann fold nucleotide-binding protein DprA/Smf involved in DNA uptake